MTPEQQRAIAMANARKRQAEAGGQVAAPQSNLTPAQEFANEQPIARTVGRSGRAGLAGLSSLVDIPLLVPKTLALMGSMGADAMGFPKVSDALERLGRTPTVADTARGLVDQATGGRLQPTGTIDKIGDFGAEMIASAVPFSRANPQAITAPFTQAPPSMGTAVKSVLDPETALNQLPSVQATQVPDISALRSIATRPNVSLLETNQENLKRLARGSAQYPSGSEIAEKFFQKKIGSSGERIKTAFSKLISGKTDYYGALDDIVKTGQEEVAPLYKEAFKNNKSVSSKLIDKILETPRGKAALADAVDQMGDEMALVATPDKELGDLARELSSIGMMEKPSGGVASGLKLQTLDKIKKGFDATWRKAKEAGNREEASRINTLRKQFIAEIDRLDKTGLYAKARQRAGDYLTNEASAEAGTNIFRLDKEFLVKQVADMNAPEKEAFKVGVAKAMRDAVDNIADGRSPYSKTFGNEAIRQKLQAVLPRQDYERLEKVMNAENDLYKLRNFVLGGSPTVGKAIDASEFTPEMLDVSAQVAQRGWKGVALDKVVNYIKGVATGLSDERAKNVASILFEDDPKKKVALLQQVLGTKKGGDDMAKAYFAVEKSVKPKSVSTQPLLTDRGALAALAATNTAGQQMLPKPQLRLTNQRGY